MYLRVSLTDRCNLRCTYCLPEHASFAPTRAASSELRALMTLTAAAVKLHKIRLTGGEPTLCDDLLDQVQHARSLVPLVAMTSNGVLLAPLLPALRSAGLSRINISLDAVDPEQFRAHSRRSGLERVVAAIMAAKAAGFTTVKVNAVAMQGTDAPALVRFAQEHSLHLRFIELMAIGEARAFHGEQFISAGELRQRIAHAGISLHERQECDEPTSRVYAVAERDPTACSIGFITTVTQPFCATCDRLRLNSQGRFYTCLMDDVGVDLLTPLRNGQSGEVIARIRLAVAGKRPPARMERVGVMAAIGG